MARFEGTKKLSSVCGDVPFVSEKPQETGFGASLARLERAIEALETQFNPSSSNESHGLGLTEKGALSPAEAAFERARTTLEAELAAANRRELTLESAVELADAALERAESRVQALLDLN